MANLSRLLLILLGCVGIFAHASDPKYGVGFVIGEPVALSGKYYQSKEKAFDFQFSVNSHDYIMVYGDYLFHFPKMIEAPGKFFEQLSPYMGVGPLVVFGTKTDHAQGQYFDSRTDKLALGARVPFGVEWLWDRAPLGIGLELVPGIVVTPATSGFMQGGLTFRYYF